MKTIYKLLTIIFIGYMTIIAGCEKDKKTIPEDILHSQFAKITYANPATDGCGWIINIDDKEYHPINLDALYKVDGLEIDIRYHILSSEWECPQWKPRKFKQIEIISISLNN